MSSSSDDVDLSTIRNQIGYAILSVANDGEVVSGKSSGVLADDKLEVRKLWRLVLEAGAVLKSSETADGGGKKLRKLTVKFEEGREYHITVGLEHVYIVAKAAPTSA